jgi:4-amino-4-deoxychorismate lyase
MAALPSSWVNGVAAGSLDTSDRAINYGDGVFETLRFYRGRLLLLSEHFARLQRGLDRLYIDCAKEVLEAELDRACAYLNQQNCEDAIVKLLVSRGRNLSRGQPGGYGGDVSDASRVLTVLACETSLLHLPARARVDFCAIRLACQPQLAGIKHCNRLEQVLAAQEVQRLGLDNGIVLNQREQVISAINGNLFSIADGRLRTPDLKECGIEGCVRNLLLEKIAPGLGLVVDIGPMEQDELLAADEVFISNSVVGIQSLTIGDTDFSSEVTDELRDAYIKAVTKNTEGAKR